MTRRVVTNPYARSYVRPSPRKATASVAYSSKKGQQPSVTVRRCGQPSATHSCAHLPPRETTCTISCAILRRTGFPRRFHASEEWDRAPVDVADGRVVEVTLEEVVH